MKKFVHLVVFTYLFYCRECSELERNNLDASLEDKETKEALRNRMWLELEGIPPSRVPVKLYGDLTLECQAVGSPPPMIYWLKNGKPLENVSFQIAFQ